MNESLCTAKDGLPVHPLEAAAPSVSLSALLANRWISTLEEAVSCLAFEEGGEERDDFLSRARDLLGERRYEELCTPAAERSLGCLFGNDSASDPGDDQKGGQQ